MFPSLALRRFAAALVGAVCSLPLAAQEWAGPAALEVRVEDAKGKNVAGAEVVLEYVNVESSSVPAPVLTDAQGRCAIGGLAPGAWALEVRKPGFMSYRAEILVALEGKPEIVAASQHNVPGAVSTMRVRLGRAKNASAARPAVVVAESVSTVPAGSESRDQGKDAKPPLKEEAPEVAVAAPAPAAAPVVSAPAPAVPELPVAPPPVHAAPAASAPAPAKAPSPPTPLASVVPVAPAASAPKPAEVPAPVSPPQPVVTAPSTPAPAPARAPAPVATPTAAPSPAPTPAPIPAPVAPSSPAPAPAPAPAPTPSPAMPAAPAAAPVRPATPAPLAPPVAVAAPMARSCFECRPGESALAVAATVAAGGGSCAAGSVERVRSVALRELDSVRSELGSGCALLRLDLPRGARYTGFRYEAEGPNGRAADCLPGKECPSGASRFVGEPIVRREGDLTTVLGLFESSADRRGTLTVYWSRTKK